LGLNPALHQAAARIGAAAALLVLPADLPLLTAQDVEQFIYHAERATVVIAPDRHCHGTNALLLASSEKFRFRFGPNSYWAHQQEARRLGLSVVSVAIYNLAFDLDTPEDLEIFGQTVYSPDGAECWSSPES
jgi:2-phospho-L-lactate guanylyltransferase